MDWEAAKEHCIERKWLWSLDLINQAQMEIKQLESKIKRLEEKIKLPEK